MTTILHLFDGTTDDEALMAAGQLRSRVGTPRYRHAFASLDGHVARRAERAGLAGDRVPRRFRFDLTVGPRLRRVIARREVDLIHAWGFDALLAAASAAVVPTVATLAAAPPEPQRSRWLQAVGGNQAAAMACPSGIVRRRLIEAGVPPDRCVVIRPGVDFQRIREANRHSARETLGLPADARVVLTPPLGPRAGEHYEASWAVALLAHMDDQVHLLVPGVSPARARLQRFADGLQVAGRLLFPGRRHAFVALLAAADVMVAAAHDDIATTSLAWAMAAGVPIVGSAVPAVTELLADRHNALLCKPGSPVVLAERVRTALEDRALVAPLAEKARGQAFEVFSVRRMVDQYRRLYDNIQSGQPAETGIADAAFRA